MEKGEGNYERRKEKRQDKEGKTVKKKKKVKYR